MDGESQVGKHVSKEVTVVVSRKIKPGCEKIMMTGLDTY
jgi:hypothetical protein